MKILNADISKEARDEGGRWTSGAAHAANQSTSNAARESQDARSSSRNAWGNHSREYKTAALAHSHATNALHAAVIGNHADASHSNKLAATEHEKLAEHHTARAGITGSSDPNQSRAHTRFSAMHAKAALANKSAAEKHQSVADEEAKPKPDIANPAPEAKSVRLIDPTLDHKIASLKPGETMLVSKGSNGTHVTAERTGDGKTVRYVRHSKNTSEVIKQHTF